MLVRNRINRWNNVSYSGHVVRAEGPFSPVFGLLKNMTSLTFTRRMDLPTLISRTNSFHILRMLGGIFLFFSNFK